MVLFYPDFKLLLNYDDIFKILQQNDRISGEEKRYLYKFKYR